MNYSTTDTHVQCGLIGGHELLGASNALERLRMDVANAARTDATVLIVGETGTGKGLIADLIHRNSRRKDGPLVAISCVEFSESLLESELFGHEKGAFTGADKLHLGKFEQANHGTIFVDEIHTCPRHVQVKLLRVLQERKLARVGGKVVIDLDIRVLAATNRDLQKQVSEGEFQIDLYHRIARILVRAPPLRESQEDIPELAKHYAEEYATRDGKQFVGFTHEAIGLLRRQNWPANVRQLQNVIDRAFCETQGGLDAKVIQDALDQDSMVFGSLNRPSAPATQEVHDEIADLVLDDLLENRMPLQGIKAGSAEFGPVALRLIRSCETGFTQFLETAEGRKLLQQMGIRAILNQRFFGSAPPGKPSLLMKELRQRLTEIGRKASRQVELEHAAAAFSPMTDSLES